LEALACGVPVIALNDGGHPEIVKNGGLFFNNHQELLDDIEEMVRNYDKYKNNIVLLPFEKVAKQYYDFSVDIFNKINDNHLKRKKVNTLKYYMLRLIITFLQLNIGIFKMPIIKYLIKFFNIMFISNR